MANLMHYSLHRLKIRPSVFVEMPKWEKAFVLASVQLHLKKEAKYQKDAERANRSAKARRR